MPDQQWSKIKKTLDSLRCDSLKKRVQFTVTNYRKAHDQTGRAFITVDKKEVFNMCTLTSDNAVCKKEQEIQNAHQIKYDVSNGEQNLSIQSQAHEMIISEGIFAQYDFFNAVEEYINSPIEKSLQSENILIKILTLIDRRVGKRTLKKMTDSVEKEKDIVQYFYRLRCGVEGLS